MPLTHLDIKQGWGKRTKLTVSQALDRALKGELDGWTFELLNALLLEQQDRGTRISTTLLTTKCARSEWLKRNGPYTDDPAKLWASFRGTMFHGRLELAAHPSAIAEARYWVDLPDLGQLSGSPDLMNPVLGILYDYKTNKENPRFDKPWDDHILQVQVNRWLVDHAFGVEYDGCFHVLQEHGEELYAGSLNVVNDVAANRAHFVPVHWDSLCLVYLDDKGPKPITVTKSEEVIGKNGRPKKVRTPDLWDDETVESLVRERYGFWKRAFSATEPPPLNDDFARQQHPLCGFCPVRDACWEIETSGGGN